MTGGTSPTVFLVAFVVYIAVMIFIGWYSSRGKSEGTDYLTGGRGLNLLMIFGTIGATMIGTGSSMGAISNGFRSGWGGSTYGLGCCLALVLIGLLFSGLREKNFITMSEEAQYYFDGSSSVRKLTGILTFIAEWIFIASSINGGAKYLQFLTGMDVLVSKIVCVLAFGVYVYVGGYLAVVWTDVIQLGILLVGFAAIIIKAVPSAGGWDAIRATYEAAGNNGAMTFYGLGSTGFMAAISLIVASALGEMGAPTFRTRIYTAKDPKTARKGFIFAAIMTLLFSLVPSIIGMSAYTMATANEVLAVLENPDFAFAYMATNVLAPALGLLLMVSGLSATLSSGDSDAIAGATILMEDIYPLLNHGKRIPENKMKNASRIAVVITLFASFLVSLKADGVMAFINNVLGAMMPGMVLTLIIGRLWTKRVTAAAGMCSMVGGTLFGLCYLLIPSLADLLDKNFSGPAIPCAVLTSVICVVVTLCTKRSGKSEQEILDTVLAGRTDLAAK